jgi:hypothetical protein
MMIQVLALGTTLLKGAIGYFTEKQKMKAVETQGALAIAKATNLAKIDRIQAGDLSATDLDSLSVKDRGYKDDYLLFVGTVPLILVFIPYFVPHITEGFKVLATLPEWYRWVVLGVYIDTFGFRRILRVVLEKYLTKRFGG